MLEMKERIFIQTLQLVSKYGIRVMSMDSLANEMGVSKKTIYQFYSNKNEIIVACVAYIIADLDEKVERIIEGKENPLINM